VPRLALHDQGLDADRQPHADVDPGDDEHDQPEEGGQPDQDADDQDGAEPGEAEAVALLDAEVLPGDFRGDGPGDRSGEHLVEQQPDERGQQ
jgi:hypothetical protein